MGKDDPYKQAIRAQRVKSACARRVYRYDDYYLIVRRDGQQLKIASTCTDVITHTTLALIVPGNLPEAASYPNGVFGDNL